MSKEENLSLFAKIKNFFKRDDYSKSLNTINEDADKKLDSENAIYDNTNIISDTKEIINKEKIREENNKEEIKYHTLTIKYVDSKTGEVIPEATEEISIEDGKLFQIIKKGRIVKGYKNINFNKTVVLNSNDVIEIPVIVQQPIGRGINIFE